MKRTQSVNLYLIIMLVFLITGCSTVPVDLTPSLAPEVRATLTGNDPVYLMQVDDEKAGKDGFNHWEKNDNWNGNYIIYLSPGIHTLIVGYSYQPKRLILQTASSQLYHGLISAQLGSIQFEAQSGHSYALVGELSVTRR